MSCGGLSPKAKYNVCLCIQKRCIKTELPWYYEKTFTPNVLVKNGLKMAYKCQKHLNGKCACSISPAAKPIINKIREWGEI